MKFRSILTLIWFASATSGCFGGWGNGFYCTSPSVPSSAVSAITADSSGNIYAAGSVADFKNDSTHGIVRKLSRKAAGSTSQWTTVDDFIGHPNSIHIDPTGAIYVAGWGAGSWFIRKSANEGKTWSTIKTMPYYLAGPRANLSLSLSLTGSLLLFNDISSYNLPWSGRLSQSLDQGGEWSDIASVSVSDAPSQSDYRMRVDSQGNYYLLGAQNDYWHDATSSGQVRHWAVRRSQDSGATWALLDLVTGPRGTTESFPASVASNATGHIFVAGTYYDMNPNNDGSGGSHWFVRRSLDHGASWSVSDDLHPLGGSAHAHSVLVSAGAVFVAGGSGSQDFRMSKYNWTIRRSSDWGTSWQTVDEQNDSFAAALYADTDGNLYAGGGSRKLDSQWIIRKSSDGGSTWTTSDQFAFPEKEDPTKYESVCYDFKTW